jgi:hypothetical protein
MLQNVGPDSAIDPRAVGRTESLLGARHAPHFFPTHTYFVVFSKASLSHRLLSGKTQTLVTGGLVSMLIGLYVVARDDGAFSSLEGSAPGINTKHAFQICDSA